MIFLVDELVLGCAFEDDCCELCVLKREEHVRELVGTVVYEEGEFGLGCWGLGARRLDCREE